MRDAAPSVTTLRRRKTFHNRSFNREGNNFSAPNLLITFAFYLAPILEKILSALFMNDIKQCTASNAQDHNDYIGLHDSWRHERRKLGVRIDGEHQKLQISACYSQIIFQVVIVKQLSGKWDRHENKLWIIDTTHAPALVTLYVSIALQSLT